MMGGWIVQVILGIVYGINASRGEWAAYPLIGQWSLPKKHPDCYLPGDLVTTLRCSSRDASDTIIRLL